MCMCIHIFDLKKLVANPKKLLVFCTFQLKDVSVQ